MANPRQDYQKAEQYDKYDPARGIPASDDPDMPARLLYEEIFPALVKEYIEPSIPYKPSSPFGGAWANDPTIGDCHQWRKSRSFYMSDVVGVWAKDRRPYQDWDQLSARFVSEFGMLSFPNMATIKQ